MKKIILAIFTVMLTLAIFGCGKAQQASGGGGSSGGGGGNTKTTFDISGAAQVPSSIADDLLYASWPERLGRGLASVFIPQVYAADFGFKPLKNADVKVFELGTDTIVVTAKTGNDGRYSVSLPLGKIYVVAMEKAASDGSATINIKNIAHEENPVVDVTPITSVVVEAISQNSTIRETLIAVNTGSGGGKPDVSAVAGIVETVQENVETYYDTHTDEIDNVDVTSPAPPDVSNIPKIEEYTLIITVSPSEAESSGVTVNKTPAPNGSNGKYLKGTKVKLQAISNAPYRFDQWSGANGNAVVNNEITLNTGKTITAEFVKTVVVRVPKAITDGVEVAKVNISPAPNPRTFSTYVSNSGMFNGNDGNYDFYEYIYDYGTDVTLSVELWGQRNVFQSWYILATANMSENWPGNTEDIYTANPQTISVTQNCYWLVNIYSEKPPVNVPPVSAVILDGLDNEAGFTDYLFKEGQVADTTTDNVVGTSIYGMKLGQKDGVLYFQLKPDNGVNKNLRYDIGINPSRDGDQVNINVLYNDDGGQWVRNLNNNSEQENDTNVSVNEVIEVGIPIAKIKEWLGTQTYYAVQVGIMDDSLPLTDGHPTNYYRTEHRNIVL
ncbi:hypothetical protein NO1_1145 [Candidatus Termititenax aidoneus]|uniref:Bacterial repeat domain-containing protein n=1 Tax=Termititenax aidoneus TaxID=2218524 RepID=A0A388TDB3_TERA1|nr:hypothetical protein NO1_1145 [Candidatus Termititenax aidoneus]